MRNAVDIWIKFTKFLVTYLILKLVFHWWIFSCEATFFIQKQQKLGSYFFYFKKSLIVCSCHVTYAFQSESTFYNCLNVKELLARNRHEIWSLNLKPRTTYFVNEHSSIWPKWEWEFIKKLLQVKTFASGKPA